MVSDLPTLFIFTGLSNMSPSSWGRGIFYYHQKIISEMYQLEELVKVKNKQTKRFEKKIMVVFFKKCNKKTYDCSSPRGRHISTEEMDSADCQNCYY